MYKIETDYCLWLSPKGYLKKLQADSREEISACKLIWIIFLSMPNISKYIMLLSLYCINVEYILMM